MKKYFKYSMLIAVISLVALVPNGHKVLASPSLDVSETVANVGIATIPTITFAGGVTGVAATSSITISDTLAAAATDQTIAIDGVSIALGNSALTAAQVADKIVYQLTGGVDGAYTVATTTPTKVLFTRTATGAAGNGTLAIGDANYTKTNEVKATRTLTVSTVVASSTAGNPAVQLTVGTCVVTFATTTNGTASLNGVSLTADEANCADNAAVILLATSSVGTDVALTVSQTAAELRGLTNVSETGTHGALTVGGAGSTLVLTTTGAETSATSITASQNTGTAITLNTVDTAGVIKVTSTVPSITFSGGVTAAKATATITVPAGLPASATQQSIAIDGVTITLGSSALTAAQVADDIVYLLTGGLDGAYTVATSTPTSVVFTRSSNGVAGNGTLAMGDATYSGKARVVVFTPSGPTTRYTYTVTIDGTGYSYDFTEGGTLRWLVEGIKGALSSASSVTCTEDDTAITCTAVVAGTTFTSSTSVAADAAAQIAAAGSSHSGGGGGGGSRVTAQTTPVVTISAHGVLTPVQIQAIINQIKSLLILVQRLQMKLRIMRGY